MKKIAFLFLITSLIISKTDAQFKLSPEQQRVYDSIRNVTNADYKTMLAQLQIDSTRPGPSGNPKDANAANSDESKVPAYTLPDALTLKNGEKVTDANTWWTKRRPEIVEDFDKEIYGRVPANTPKVNWEIVNTRDTVIGNIKAITKQLLGHVDNSSYPQIKVDIQLTLTTPADTKDPVPVIMEFGFIWPPGFVPPRDASKSPPPSWQQQILEKGWGYAVLIPASYQADNGAGLTQGIIGLCNKGLPRKSDDWGALRAWAWGAGRAIDYLETDKTVDAKRIGIEGLSRYGKAALVAMAYEPRIAIGFIGSSGAGGAKILRRAFGEQVENLASSFEYHWFAGNFIKYAGPLTPDDLPVDAHELIALCAPRPVFISVGSPTVEGQWIDARGMFIAAANAAPVYTLLGKKDLGTTEFPPIETSLMNGDIAFRQHSGGHTTGPNWPYFLQFAERYFNNAATQTGLRQTDKGLKDYYHNYFPMGVAVSPRALKTDEAQLIIQQFNSITPENAMKMGPIHPKENEYNWKDADSIVSFAQAHNLKVRGHTLCWHEQTPAWLFKDSAGNLVSKDILLKRLKDHITTVVSRYKGKIYAWDVVNEAIDDDSTKFLRNSLWYQICGEDFIMKAFEYAHEADPAALLFYNDYNTERREKTERVYKLLKQLKDANVPIHGVGLQAHWNIYEPTQKELEYTIQRFASPGLQIQITELDISIYPWEKNRRQKTDKDIDAFTPDPEQKQMQQYKMAFDVFRRYKQYITSVTFWNISDRHTWLDNYPVAGRKNYPLLFDKDLQPKKAYWKVVNF